MSNEQEHEQDHPKTVRMRQLAAALDLPSTHKAVQRILFLEQELDRVAPVVDAAIEARDKRNVYFDAGRAATSLRTDPLAPPDAIEAAEKIEAASGVQWFGACRQVEDCVDAARRG